jgi:hypothetical protein
MMMGLLTVTFSENMMTDTQHQINVSIAETLEKLQDLNPDLYGFRYSQLYSNKGYANLEVWTESMLHQIEQDLIDNAK